MKENVFSVSSQHFPEEQSSSAKLSFTHLCVLKLGFQAGCIFGKLDAFLLCLLQQSGDVVQLILQSKQPKGESTAQTPLGWSCTEQNLSKFQVLSPTDRDSKLKPLKFGYKMQAECQS